MNITGNLRVRVSWRVAIFGPWVYPYPYPWWVPTGLQLFTVIKIFILSTIIIIARKYTSQVNSRKTNRFVLRDALMHVNIIFYKNAQNEPLRFAHFCEILASRLIEQ